jgi:hypothetical protein
VECLGDNPTVQPIINLNYEKYLWRQQDSNLYESSSVDTIQVVITYQLTTSLRLPRPTNRQPLPPHLQFKSKGRIGYLQVPFTYFLLISFTRAPSGLQLLVLVNFNTCTAFCDSFSHRDMRLVCATLLYVFNLSNPCQRKYALPNHRTVYTVANRTLYIYQ